MGCPGCRSLLCEQAGALCSCLCSSCCCCGPSICCQEPVVPRCSGGRGSQGWREPSGAPAAPATGLACWRGEGGGWQGGSGGLGKAGSSESVCSGLSDGSLPLCAGGQSSGGCSWFLVDDGRGLWLQPSAARAEPCPSSPRSGWRGITPPVCWAALPSGLWSSFWGPMLALSLCWRGSIAAASALAGR